MRNDMDIKPVVHKKHGISPVWTLPLIALSICCWILFRSYQNAGIDITVYFEDASGITSGKTQVIAKGIPIGIVKSVKPDLENNRIRTIVKMDKGTEKLLVEDTLFWIVRPELSATRIYGLETILSGSYIGIQTGVSSVRSIEFKGLSNPPPVPDESPGLHLFLRADALRSVQIGSGVYYRNIRIGSVQTYTIENKDNILINLHIEPAYSHLVREGSRFNNASGVTFSGKLPDLKVHVESIASLLMGGIVLDTPEPLQTTPPAKNGQVFFLYRDIDAAKYGLQMTLNLASGDGIVEGATKVMYRGLDAGFVEKIDFNNDEHHTVTAHILLDPRVELILRKGTKFWITRPEITVDGIKNLGSILSGPHITFEPGEGPFQNHFEILPVPPSQKPLRPGSEYILTTEDPGSLAVGAPVVFKNIQVGEIVSVNLTRNAVQIKIYIYQPNERLLGQNSVFWKSGGIKVDAGLFSGLKIDTGPLSSVFRGGISFMTPDSGGKKVSQLREGHSFTLYNSMSDSIHAVPSLHPPGYYFQIKADDLGPYKVGSPILFKKVNVGEIIGFHFSGKERDVLIDCFIKQPYMEMVSTASRFYDLSGLHVEGSLTGLSLQTGSLESIISAGIGFLTPPGGGKPEIGVVYPLFKNEETARTADDVKLTIHFPEAGDLKIGSLVKHQGVTIGKVTETHFADDLKTIIAQIVIRKNVASLFRKSTKIWLVTPTFDLSGIKNLDTITSGPYITLAPGEGPLTQEFIAFKREPQITIPQKGLNLVLVTKHLGSLKIHAPVYYRQIQVGQVTGFELSDSFQDVLINVNIDTPYVPIIRENTRFWNVSGARIEGGLFSGVSVTTDSVEAIVAGGIALATPGNMEMGDKVGQGHRFELHDQAENGWLEWDPRIMPVEDDKKVAL